MHQPEPGQRRVVLQQRQRWRPHRRRRLAVAKSVRIKTFRASRLASVSASSPLAQLGNPLLIAVSCLRPMSVAIPGSMGSLGALSNSRLTKALPSLNNSTVTAWELSGDVPEIIAPLDPTSTGCHVPLTLPA